MWKAVLFSLWVAETRAQPATPTVTMTPSLSASLTPTATQSLSASLSLPTETGSWSLTLPTASATFSPTLPTATTTFTASNSISATIPTATESMTASLSLSVSVTVPTATATFTFSHTTSETASLSSTLSESSTFTATQTVNAISNYTAHAEPSDFVEGQDVRIRVSAYLRGDEKRALGNGSSARSLSAFAHRADFEHDCLLYAERAGPLFVTTDWGVGDADRTAADAWLHAVYFTVTAPHAAVEFVLCFREDPDEAWDVGGLGLWELLRVSSGGGEMAVLRSRESRVWYHLPDASARQYAVVRLVSGEVGWNFTHAASAACGASVQSLAGCGLGDALKLVPAGRPCTSERRQRSPLPYYGSQHLVSDGGWLAAAADTLVEGSTPGGVGLFGSGIWNFVVGYLLHLLYLQVTLNRRCKSNLDDKVHEQ